MKTILTTLFITKEKDLTELNCNSTCLQTRVSEVGKTVGAFRSKK